MIWAYDGWLRFWSLSSKRPIDWGTFWYIGAHLPVSPNSSGGIEPFLSLGADIPLLNTVTYLLFGLGCLGVLALALRAPVPPRLAQLCFIVIAMFLLTSKVWSQQFVLWVIPLAVLARPRWGAFLAWQLAELGYFFAFYAQMLNISGAFTIPEGTYVLASFLRWLLLAVLVGSLSGTCCGPSSTWCGAPTTATIRTGAHSPERPTIGGRSVPRRPAVVAYEGPWPARRGR